MSTSLEHYPILLERIMLFLFAILLVSKKEEPFVELTEVIAFIIAAALAWGLSRIKRFLKKKLRQMTSSVEEALRS